MSGLACITRRSPVASALWLVVTLFSLAALFVLLDAQFIAVLQVLVYAGAIMVLFLFVIMLLSLGDVGPASKITLSRIAGGLASFALLGALLFALFRIAPSSMSWMADSRQVAQFGSLQRVGEVLYTSYLL